MKRRQPHSTSRRRRKLSLKRGGASGKHSSPQKLTYGGKR